jgi:hypothetical protein
MLGSTWIDAQLAVSQETLTSINKWIIIIIYLEHYYQLIILHVWVWVLCYDRRSVGQSVLE